MTKTIYLLLLISSPLIAGVSVSTTQDNIVIDGILDEAAWQHATQIDLPYEIEPGINTPASVITTIYLLDTGQSLVIGFDAQDPNPDQIVAYLHDRDAAYQDDRVGILLDTFNDQTRALGFFVNPLGVQIDFIRAENQGEDDSWDAIWDSAGQITATGYQVEMEIPYTELQIPAVQGEKSWGIFAQRIYPRSTRMVLQNVVKDRNNNCFLCQTATISGFGDAQQGKGLQVTPSFTAVSNQSRSAANEPFNAVTTDFEPSLDIKWGIDSNRILNATLNPDFSQVESDAAQLTANETFAPFVDEKRAFFLENSDVFNSHLDLVHTRNIATPDYGLRLVGKSDNNAYGLFVTNDNQTNILIPGVFGSRFARIDDESLNMVGRYRRNWGDGSSVGFTGTHRSAGDYENRLLSVDSHYRINNKHSLDAQWAYSENQYSDRIIEDFDQPQGQFNGQAHYLRYQYADKHWSIHIDQTDRSDGFRADSGFIGKIGFTQTVAGAAYTWFSDSAWWQDIRLYSDWDITHDQSGQLIEKEFEGDIHIHAPMQSHISLGGGVRDRLWDGQLFGEDFIFAGIDFKPWKNIRTGLNINTGQSVDFSNNRLSDSTDISWNINANLGRHFKINVNHNHRNLSYQSNNVLIVNQSDIRLSYQFNIRQRLRLALISTRLDRNLDQYINPENFQQDSHFMATQLVYSYKINPRTLMYFGYSDAGLDNDNIESFTTTDQSLFAKFSYAFQM